MTCTSYLISQTPLNIFSCRRFLRLTVSYTLRQMLAIATIVITDCKHNSSRRPFSVVLDRATGPEFCPVHYLQRYCSMRGLTPGALFSFSDGSPVKTSHFTQQLLQALKFCGLDSSQYKAHSFRIGAPSSAADNGLSDAQIRHLGRWKSDAFKLYIRQPPERFKI